MRLWGWAAVSRGARAISYYAYYPMSSGYESNGYGLIELDGTITDRAKAAGAFAATVTREAALIDRARPRPAPVAVLYNRLSYMVGGNTVGPGTTVRNSMVGFYRAMFERNIPVDFIHSDELAAGAASRYRAVFLGTPLMLPRSAADALRTYVRDGGVLISEARPAWNDDRGFANVTIPGAGLDEVFGARERELRSPETVAMQGLGGSTGPMAQIADLAIPGVTFEEHLQPQRADVRVLARFANGDPAITDAPFGRGRAILVGSFPAAAFEQDPARNRAAGTLLQALISDVGVAPDIDIAGGDGMVEARVLDAGEARILIAINHDDTPHRVTLRLASPLAAGPWTDIETRSPFPASDGGLSWKARARDVLVIVQR